VPQPFAAPSDAMFWLKVKGSSSIKDLERKICEPAPTAKAVGFLVQIL
jgi:hypothetical protein